MDAETISVSLPTELADLIRQQVANGSYASNSDLVEDALRLWRQRADGLADIRKSLDEAADDPTSVTSDEMRAYFIKRGTDLLPKS